MKKPFSLLASLALISTTALAQATLPSTDAEVRKVDRDAKKITLKHGEIKNLDMPPMSMVFQVKDPAMLETVKAGDKVTVTVDRINGAYTVVSMEAKK